MKFLVWDLGLSVEHAVKLAKEGHEVYYFTPWASTYPKFEPYAYGIGMEGINKVKFFFDYIDDVDCICFFDIGAGDLANFLREKGYTVYGAGLGEHLEYDRFQVRRLQQKLGLPVQATQKITGMSQLEEYLKPRRNKYVKISTFRGDCESFKFRDYESDKTLLDELKVKLGPLDGYYEFIVENIVEGIEPGVDLFFNGMNFLKPYLWGYEFNKKCYIGKYVTELPRPLSIVFSLQDIMRQLNYRGAFSAEMIVNNEGSHLIDICGRFAYPLSVAYTKSINNFGELVYKIAKGENANLEVNCKYIGVVPIVSAHADLHWTNVQFPEEIRDKVMLHNACKVDGNYYIKGEKIWITVIETGNTIEEVVENLKETVPQVDAHEIDHDATVGLDKILELSEEGAKRGLSL